MAKSAAERQREYQQRHPDRERAKQARFAAAEKELKDRHRDEYKELCIPRLPQSKRYRQAMRDLKTKHPDEWKEILSEQPADE